MAVFTQKADSILRILMMIIMGVMFMLVVTQGNLLIFDKHDDRIQSNILIGGIALIIGLCLAYEYQGFTDLMGKSVAIGGALLLLINGTQAFLVASKETQILTMGIIFVTLLYESTWLV